MCNSIWATAVVGEAELSQIGTEMDLFMLQKHFSLKFNKGLGYWGSILSVQNVNFIVLHNVRIYKGVGT